MGILHLFPRGTLTYDSEGIYSTEFFTKGRVSYDEIIDMSFMKANLVTNGHIRIKTHKKSFILYNFSIKRNNEAKIAYDEILRLKNNFVQKNIIKENKYNAEGAQLYQKLKQQRKNRIKQNEQNHINEQKRLKEEQLKRKEQQEKLKAEQKRLESEKEKIKRAKIEEEQRIQRTKEKEEQLQKEKLIQEKIKIDEKQETLNHLKSKRIELERQNKKEEDKQLEKIRNERLKLKKELDLQIENQKNSDLLKLRKEKELKQKQIKEQQKELEQLSSIDLNKASIDDLLKIPQLDIYKVETIMDLRQNGIYINSFDELGGLLNLSSIKLNEMKQYIKIKKVYTVKKKNLNKMSIQELLRLGLDEQVISNIIIDRSRGIKINTFEELKSKYSCTYSQIQELKKATYISDEDEKNEKINLDNILNETFNNLKLNEETVKSETSKKQRNKKIDINQANPDELINLKCFTKGNVEKIIELRKNNQYINSYEHLKTTLNLTNKQLNQICEECIISKRIVKNNIRKIDL